MARSRVLELGSHRMHTFERRNFLASPAFAFLSDLLAGVDCIEADLPVVVQSADAGLGLEQLRAKPRNLPLLGFDVLIDGLQFGAGCVETGGVAIG